MILPDTSIWVDHYRRPSDSLAEYLAREMIVQHPFVTGELALGNMIDRRARVAELEALPEAAQLSQGDLLRFVEIKELGGTGLGLVDAHLLGSAARANLFIWTRDERLASQADRLGLLFAAD